MKEVNADVTAPRAFWSRFHLWHQTVPGMHVRACNNLNIMNYLRFLTCDSHGRSHRRTTTELKVNANKGYSSWCLSRWSLTTGQFLKKGIIIWSGETEPGRRFHWSRRCCKSCTLCTAGNGNVNVINADADEEKIPATDNDALKISCSWVFNK